MKFILTKVMRAVIPVQAGMTAFHLFHPFHLLLVALLVAATATAQPVYESRDRAGPVFSDLPTPGASELTLPPINVMDSPPEPPVSPVPSEQAAVSYSALKIMQPENGGTVHSNTGQFSVEISIEPPLQTARGDAIAVRLDKTLLSTPRATLRFEISPAEWRSVATDTAEHQLEVAVVDRSGKAIIISPPVRFYMHRASRL